MPRTVAVLPRELRADWRKAAECLHYDPELFHPLSERGAVAEAQIAEAKAVCAVCPVRVECLAHALGINEAKRGYPVQGIWGGTSESERRGLTRRDVLAEAGMLAEEIDVDAESE